MAVCYSCRSAAAPGVSAFFLRHSAEPVSHQCQSLLAFHPPCRRTAPPARARSNSRRSGASEAPCGCTSPSRAPAASAGSGRVRVRAPALAGDKGDPAALRS